MKLYVAGVDQQIFLDSSESQATYGLITIAKDSDSNLIISFPSGAGMKVGVGAKMLAMAFIIPEAWRHQITGLVGGNFNGDPSDDLKLPNGNIVVNL